ncbi:MAG: arginine--tRNA ligase, partial [Bdellovibrionales bacterium]|nr:arginine--tRNA ligase [Bdellovibrionales bacterium]
MMTDDLSTTIAKFISQVLKKDLNDVLRAIEIPTHHHQGDRALPCFRWSKEAKKAPKILAEVFKKEIEKSELPEDVDRVEALSGYLNFYAKTDVLTRKTLNQILSKPTSYGFVDSKAPPLAIIEFSSPNIAKPFSIGHLRSTNIGACLSRIFQARGWKVVRINHLGDWGTQFGKLMSAYRRWGKAEDLQEYPMDALYKLYVKFHEQEVSDPTLIDEAREWFSKLEKGDSDAKELWEWFREMTMKELSRLYGRLGVEFDHFWGESYYVHLLPELVSDLEAQGIAKESERALIVDLEPYNLHTCLIQKKDESSLYMTRDLAAAIYREEKFSFDQMLYVVGTPQKLHFQQLFKLLDLMGKPWHKKCEHIMFGHMAFGDEAMSTRKGNIVFLKDVIDKSVEMARQTVEEKNPELENKDMVAEQVGLGAI